MRLLFISNLYPPLLMGGYEIACQSMVHELRARGHEIHLLTSTFRLRGELLDEEHVYRRLKLRSDWGGAPSDATPWLESHHIRAERHNTQVTKDLITHLQPDAILIWNGGGLGMSLLATAEKHPRIAYYLQDMWLAPILTYRQRGGWKQFLRRGVRRVLSLPNTVVRGSHLIFVSRDLAARYQEAGVHRPNHAVVYNGVPAGMIPNDTPPRRVPTQAKILYVGQIISTKGIHVMVEALAQVRERPGLEHAELSLVGPLPDREYVEELENRINQLQLQRHIHFIPPQPRVALPEIFSQHDVFAFPVVWKEPFAITLVEALAAGIPVVSTLTGGQVEIIRDQENALVVRAGDASDLAEKLGWLLLNPDKAMRLAKAAQHDVRGKFTIELQAEGVETYLHHLLHGGELRTMGGT